LNITGDATVGATFLNFLCTVTVAGAQPCPAGYGNFITSPTSNGSFTPYIGDPGFIQSINQIAEPLNTNFLASNFLTFSGLAGATVLPPDIALDLRFINLGTQGQAACSTNPALAAPGQNCTPVISALVTAANPLGLSPFNLQNTATGSTASFAVSGTARRISTNEASPFGGLFTAQFTSSPGTANGSYQAILSQLASNGAISTTYSASFTATAVDASLSPAPDATTTSNRPAVSAT